MLIWLRQKNFFNLILLFSPAILLGLMNIAMVNRYFPLTEGWWETYGYLINNGMVPYTDFYLAFPPLFVLLNAFYLKLTHSFLLIRYIGIFIFSLNILLAQIILRELFEAPIAAIATLLAGFLLFSDIVLIAKDYHTYALSAALLTFLIAEYIVEGEIKSPRSFLNQSILIFCLGTIIAITAMLKQNIGYFLFLAYGISLSCALRLKWQRRLLFLGMYTAGFVFTLFSVIYYYRYVQGISLENLAHIFINNDSKGSKFYILTRFLTNADNRHIVFKSLFFTLVYLWFYINLNRVKGWGLQLTSTFKLKTTTWIKLSWLGLLLVLFLLYRHHFYVPFVYHDVITLAISILLFLFIKCFFVTRNTCHSQVKFLLIPILTLIYCNTQTATLNTNGMFIPILFGMGFFLDFLKKFLSVKPFYVFLLVLIPVSAIALYKIKHPYSWWQNEQDSITDAHFTLPYPELKGIYVDDKTQNAFRLINNSINLYSKSKNDVYLFPNIPIFYLLNHKIPPYKGVVQWFDVISSDSMKKELQNFSKKTPRVVIYFDPPNAVYLGHRELIGRSLMQLDLRDRLNRLVDNSVYDVTCYPYVSKKQEDKTTAKITHLNLTKIQLKNRKFVNKPLWTLYSILNNDNFPIQSIIRKGILLDINENSRMQYNDIIVFSSDDKKPDFDYSAIGCPVGDVKDYVIKIFILKSAK